MSKLNTFVTTVNKSMSKLNIFIVVILTSIVGIVGVETYDTTPVTHSNCEVTGTYRNGGGKTSVKHYIETKNCDTLRAKRKVVEKIETGKTYDFIGTGIFTWEKVVSEFQPAKTIIDSPPHRIGTGLEKQS